MKLTVQEVVDRILAADGNRTTNDLDARCLAPHIERAVDAVIDKILGQGIPEDVRAAWHDVFVAAMMEET